MHCPKNDGEIMAYTKKSVAASVSEGFMQHATAWSFLILLIAGLAAYANSFGVPFQFDDLPNISNNPDVHMVELSPDAILRSTAGPTHRRPLAYISFGLNYYFGRNDVFGYHFVNFLLHLLNSFLVYLISARLFTHAAKTISGRRKTVMALCVSLLFLTHPIQTQAVTYIVQRMTSMAAFFALLATLFYLKARTEQRHKALNAALAVLMTITGFLGKENIFMLPGILLVSDFIFFDDFRMMRERKPGIFYGISAVVCAVLLAGAVYFWPIILDGYKFRSFTMIERVLTQFRVVFHYLSLIAFPLPSRFHLDYDYPLSRSILSPPSTLLGIAAFAALCFAAWHFRKKHPLASFAMIWYFGHLLIESSVVPLEIIFEHRAYLPSFGIFLAAVYGLERVVSRISAERLAMAAASMLMILLCAATLQRNHVWANPVRLFEESAMQSPNKARTHMNVGWSQYYAGDFDNAEKAFLKVIEMDSEDKGAAFNNLGNIYRTRGNMEKAEHYYRKAMSIDPELPDPRISLTAVLMQGNRLNEARQELLSLLQIDPKNAKAHTNLGTVYATLGDAANARKHYDAAVSLDPGESSSYLARARFLASLKLNQQAQQDVADALKISRDNPETMFQAATVFNELGQTDKALEYYIMTLKMAPDMPQLNFQIGNIYAFKGSMEAAEKHFLRETQVQPYSPAYNNLGNIYWSKKDIVKAREAYLKAVEIDPANETARANLALLNGAR